MSLWQDTMVWTEFMGRRFVRVALTEETRGGLLGQSSILMLGSTGKDSHPIRRAVWLRDRL